MRDKIAAILWDYVSRGSEAETAADAIIAALPELKTHRGDDVHPVEAAMRDDGWQPIETAPKDGGVFLGYNKDLGWQCTMIYDWGNHVFLTDAGRFFTYPTHWRPLPAAPLD
jgi:hypothetical protein